MNLLPTRVGAGVAAVALIATAIPAHASNFPCFEETEMQSARIHDLRVMLMVNALKCRQLSPATLRQYGQFLDQRSDELKVHGENVQRSMVARYGQQQGKLAFNDYETRIGNYHSGTRPTRELCQDVNTFLKMASRANHAELETLSKLATNRSISTCRVPAAANFAAPAVEAPLAPDTDPAGSLDAPSVAPAEAPKVVDGIPTYTDAAAAPSSEPEPLETVALSEPETPASEPEPDKLTQAISALDAAAAALRDMQVEGNAKPE
ncbi:MAG: hypothetical protein QNJ15_07985 [Erythrobacter sp.]|nr:hypothetical protein [Erythrobacter sp.]